MALFLVIGSGHVLRAQDSGSDQKQEQQAREELERQEREQEMREDERIARQKMLQLQQEKMREMELQHKEQAEIMRVRAREMAGARDVYISSGENAPYSFFRDYRENQTQLTLRNSFRDGTDSSKGEFEVEQGTRHFRCMINGRVTSGAIRIKVTYPDGKVFKDMTINSSAEISFSQSLSISEENNKKYIGSWTYSISAEKAEGNYMLQISTN